MTTPNKASTLWWSTGTLYGLIGVVFLLSGEYVQATLWGCGAALWFLTFGREPGELSRQRRTFAYLFQAGFVLAVVIFLAGFFRERVQ